MKVPVLLLSLFLGLSIPAWSGPASDLAREVLRTGLDAGACYRVRNLRFQRVDLKQGG